MPPNDNATALGAPRVQRAVPAIQAEGASDADLSAKEAAADA